VLTKNPKHQNTLKCLTILYHKQENWNEAYHYCKMYLQGQPKDEEMINLKNMFNSRIR